MACSGGLVPVAPAQAAVLAAVLAAVHGAACPADPWNEAAFAAQLAVPGTWGFVHPRGGVVLGRTAAEQAEILTLAVAPQSRRLGLGRRLMRAAIGCAAATGAEALLLEVAATNGAAGALYAGLGFTVVGQRPRYYRDGGDAVVLRLALPPVGAG